MAYRYALSKLIHKQYPDFLPPDEYGEDLVDRILLEEIPDFVLPEFPLDFTEPSLQWAFSHAKLVKGAYYRKVLDDLLRFVGRWVECRDTDGSLETGSSDVTRRLCGLALDAATRIGKVGKSWSFDPDGPYYDFFPGSFQEMVRKALNNWGQRMAWAFEANPGWKGEKTVKDLTASGISDFYRRQGPLLDPEEKITATPTMFQRLARVFWADIIPQLVRDLVTLGDVRLYDMGVDEGWKFLLQRGVSYEFLDSWLKAWNLNLRSNDEQDAQWRRYLDLGVATPTEAARMTKKLDTLRKSVQVPFATRQKTNVVYHGILSDLLGNVGIIRLVRELQTTRGGMEFADLWSPEIVSMGLFLDPDISWRVRRHLDSEEVRDWEALTRAYLVKQLYNEENVERLRTTMEEANKVLGYTPVLPVAMQSSPSERALSHLIGLVESDITTLWPVKNYPSMTRSQKITGLASTNGTSHYIARAIEQLEAAGDPEAVDTLRKHRIPGGTEGQYDWTMENRIDHWFIEQGTVALWNLSLEDFQKPRGYSYPMIRSVDYEGLPENLAIAPEKDLEAARDAASKALTATTKGWMPPDDTSLNGKQKKLFAAYQAADQALWKHRSAWRTWRQWLYWMSMRNWARKNDFEVTPQDETEPLRPIAGLPEWSRAGWLDARRFEQLPLPRLLKTSGKKWTVGVPGLKDLFDGPMAQNDLFEGTTSQFVDLTTGLAHGAETRAHKITLCGACTLAWYMVRNDGNMGGQKVHDLNYAISQAYAKGEHYLLDMVDGILRRGGRINFEKFTPTWQSRIPGFTDYLVYVMDITMPNNQVGTLEITAYADGTFNVDGGTRVSGTEWDWTGLNLVFDTEGVVFYPTTGKRIVAGGEAEPELPAGIDPTGGAWGTQKVDSYELAPGMVLWQQDDTGTLKPIRLTRRGEDYDQKPTWGWIWLGGSQKGQEHPPTYSFSFWRPQAPDGLEDHIEGHLIEESAYFLRTIPKAKTKEELFAAADAIGRLRGKVKALVEGVTDTRIRFNIHAVEDRILVPLVSMIDKRQGELEAPVPVVLINVLHRIGSLMTEGPVAPRALDD